MNWFLMLSLIFFIVTVIDGHGNLQDPKMRSGTGKTFMGFRSNYYSIRYYYASGARHICGSGGYNRITDRTELTGPIQKVYKSGSLVTMWVFLNQKGVHNGFMRFKLCALKSPSEIVTQECFDQNLLKIKSLNETIGIPGFQAKAYIDDYTIRTPMIPNGKFNLETFNIPINVQLPPGLSCNNCVIQWEWNRDQGSGNCSFLNGTHAWSDSDSNPPFESAGLYLASYGDAVCPHNQWLNCADIKIESDPNQPSTLYKPNPVKKLPEIEKVYGCGQWLGIIDYYSKGHSGDPNQIIDKTSTNVDVDSRVAPGDLYADLKNPALWNNNTDPFKYTGAGLQCWFLGSNKAENDAYCNNCRDNCMTPGKKCPDNCLCRWFPRKLNTYSQNLKFGDDQYPDNYKTAMPYLQALMDLKF